MKPAVSAGAPDLSLSGQRAATRRVALLIVVVTAVRLVAAGLTELGNDEVYYWTYARFPAWSHFDHPAMVGWVIRLFTLNLTLTHELSIRLGAVACAAVATWLMYRIGLVLGGPRAGLFAAVLHTSTPYGSVLAGVVILPDAPLVVFWLASVALLVETLPRPQIGSRERRLVLLAGVCIGLALLSKYQAVFLAAGALSYVAVFDRRWLREPALYGAAAIAAVMATPILIWNVQNDFISFTYQGGRVTPGWALRPDYLLTELAGQIGYQNPITWALVVAALIAWFRRRPFVDLDRGRLLLLIALPLWLVFTGFSLFRSTLPHWTGPAYLTLILMAATHQSWRVSTGVDAGRVDQAGGDRGSGPGVGGLHDLPVPWRIRAPVVLVAVLLAVVVGLVTSAPASFGRSEPPTRLGEGDPTMDMYGWRQVRAGFAEVAARDRESGRMATDAPLLSYRWFPAAHLDYYVATPLGRRLLAAGTLEAVHKYFWINQQRGGIRPGDDAYYVAVSNWYEDPQTVFGHLFEEIEAVPDTIPVRRGGVAVRNAFVYRLRRYNGQPLVPDVSPSSVDR